MLPEVESQLDPRRVTPITNFGWGVFYTQHQSPYFRVQILNEKSIERLLQSKFIPRRPHTIALRYFGI